MFTYMAEHVVPILCNFMSEIDLGLILTLPFEMGTGTLAQSVCVGGCSVIMKQ